MGTVGVFSSTFTALMTLGYNEASYGAGFKSLEDDGAISFVVK